MQSADWQRKLQANGIDSDSLKNFRARICREHGYRSVSDIPLHMADHLIEMLVTYIESETECARYFWWEQYFWLPSRSPYQPPNRRSPNDTRATVTTLATLALSPLAAMQKHQDYVGAKAAISLFIMEVVCTLATSPNRWGYDSRNVPSSTAFILHGCTATKPYLRGCSEKIGGAPVMSTGFSELRTERKTELKQSWIIWIKLTQNYGYSY